MVETYFKLVLAHKRTCDESNTEVKIVPVTMIDDVRALLTERGYDYNGYPIDKV